jgi:hypothetical protein
LVQYTKAGKNVPKWLRNYQRPIKFTQWLWNIPTGQNSEITSVSFFIQTFILVNFLQTLLKNQLFVSLKNKKWFSTAWFFLCSEITRRPFSWQF